MSAGRKRIKKSRSWWDSEKSPGNLQPNSKENVMVTKKHIKSRKICKVTFEVPKSELPEGAGVETIAIVDDFNDWDSAATPMVFSKNKKAYHATVELEPSQQYLFRYLLNGGQWFNDWEADSYIPGSLGEDNCVLQTPSGE
jgi:hypothetical protein